MTLPVIQTRDHNGDITTWPHVEEAFAYADSEEGKGVWKISWDRPKVIGGRVRMLRFRFTRDEESGGLWNEVPLTSLIDAIMKGSDMTDGDND